MHYEFVEDSNYKNIVFRFNNGLMAAFVEHYCTNPACPCVNVKLQFYEVNESGNFKENLFSFALNTQTWEVSELKIQNANVAYEGLIKEFVADLAPSLKERFRIRLIRAKKYGKDEVVNWFDDLNVGDGWCFGYSEVYGE